MASAGRKATYGAVNESVVSSTGSVMRRRMNASSEVAARPISRPPPAARTKSQPTSSGVTVEVIAAIVALRATSAVASFTRLSPSRMVVMRRGRPTRRPTAVVATASGGATTAPSANAAARVSDGSAHHATRPTATVVTATRPTASSASASRTAAKSISEVRIAAAYSSGGSRPTSTRSGSSSKDGTPGMNDPTTPTITSTSGGDQPKRRDAPATNATVTTIASTNRVGSTPA